MRVELVWTVSLALLLGCGGAPPLSKPQSGPGTQNPTPPGSPSTQTGQPGPTNTPQPATCSGLTAQPLDSDWTLQFGGLSRVFHVHVPSTYDPATPTPLVIDYHGFTSNGTEEILLTGMNAKADTAGFISVHPEGTGVPEFGPLPSMPSNPSMRVAPHERRCAATMML